MGSIRNPKINRPKSLKAAVFAYQEIGYVCLKELLRRGVEVPFVVTHMDDPDEEIWFHSVADLAEENSIKVYYAEELTHAEMRKLIVDNAIDLLLSLYYRKMLPEEVIHAPKIASVNLHGSYLPRFRGRCPVNWIILKGEKFGGVSFHYMVRRPDAGDIIRQTKIPISRKDKAKDLYRKMAERAPRLLGEVIKDFESGKVKSKKQDENKATYFGGRKPEDGRISWEMIADDIYNLIRAVAHPYPGAFTYFKGNKLFVWDAEIGPGKFRGEAAPGMILDISRREGIIVGAGRGSVILKSVQLEGDGEIDAYDFAEMSKLTAGMKLG